MTKARLSRFPIVERGNRDTLALWASSPMSDDLSTRIDKHFAGLTDPRRRKVNYLLINIVTIALCADIAGPMTS